MFRGMKRATRAFGKACSDLPAIVRVSAALEEGHRPADTDMKTLSFPRGFDF